MNKFTLGVVTGMASLALAVPALATLSMAASSTSADAKPTLRWNREEPAATVEHVQEMMDRDKAFLANIDSIVVIQKDAKAAHLAALTEALSLSDDAARKEAVKNAHEAERTAMKNAIEANPALKNAMMPMMGGHGKHGRGPWGHRMMEGDGASFSSTK